MSGLVPPSDLIIRLALALALSTFLGLAFEEVYKRDQTAAPGGVRTFPLLALSGAMLYLIEPHYAAAFVAGLVAMAAWLHAQIRAAPPRHDIAASLMIPVSNLLAYVIGPVALAQPPWVAVAFSVTAVLLLGAREQLHRLARLVPPDELSTAGKFLILAGVVLPLVPDRPVTDLTPLTPFRVWLAVVAICGLSYASYLAQRYMPAKEGALLPAVLGGAYSSTATTVVLAKRQREAKTARPEFAAGIVVATAIMYLRLGVIIAFFDFRLAVILAPALVGLFALGAAISAYEWHRVGDARKGSSLAIAAANPLQLSTAVIFAALFVVFSLATAWLGSAFGETGIFALSGAVGATDIDPFVLSIAQGGAPNVPSGALCAAIIIAASSNNAVKAAYAVAFGGFALARRPAAALLGLSLFGLAAAALYVG